MTQHEIVTLLGSPLLNVTTKAGFSLQEVIQPEARAACEAGKNLVAYHTSATRRANGSKGGMERWSSVPQCPSG